LNTSEKKKAYQREWFRQKYAAIKADPELRAKLRAKKNARQNTARALARAAAKEEIARRAPTDLAIDIYRTYGPWAPLFVIQAAA
jgi:hypothetical protein